jgi:nucleoid-associated protein YgaU
MDKKIACVLIFLLGACGKFNKLNQSQHQAISMGLGIEDTSLDDEFSNYQFNGSEQAQNGQVLDQIVIKEYVVKTNETLMLIAYKLYGDYTRWRELAELNNFTQQELDSLDKNVKIKYLDYENSDQISQKKKSGLPYLVRKGDTLGKISNKVYYTSKKWRSIWENNIELIKDPNQIYAGFTLYYIPLNVLTLLSPTDRGKLRPVR